MKKLLPFLIIVSSILLFPVPGEHNIVHTPRYALLILSASILFGCVMFKVSRWMCFISVLLSLTFFRTLLLAKASKFYLFEYFILASAFFLIYYSIRVLKPKVDVLKWFLIPIWINIIYVIIQAYYPFLLDNFIFSIKDEGIKGMFGNAGYTACFLGVMTPVFIKYFKWGIPFLMFTIFLCNGFVGAVACVASILTYLFYTKRKYFYIFLSIVLIVSVFYSPKFLKSGETRIRAGITIHTLKGIMHRPFRGWGMGTYTSIFARIKSDDSEYFGVRFNTPNAIASHPHNGLLLGWWNCGAWFPLLIIGYFISLIRRFNKKTVLLNSMIIGCAFVALGSIYSFPMIFLLALVLGLFDNLFKNQGGVICLLQKLEGVTRIILRGVKGKKQGLVKNG